MMVWKTLRKNPPNLNILNHTHPPRSDPSTTRQAANKGNHDKNIDLQSLMENTLESEKLLDLVSSAMTDETLNAITAAPPVTETEPNTGERNAFSGILEPDNGDLNDHRISVPIVTPENALLSNPYNSSIILEPTPSLVTAQRPVGHNTVTTTDERRLLKPFLHWESYQK